jgi:hypothetical protein
MYALIALLVLGLSGDPAMDGFEGWTPPETELAVGEVRVIGTYSTRLEYYILEEPPQMTLRARGPAQVILKILGHESGRVKIGLDLDAAMMEEEVVQVFESLPTELFLSVPEGRHMIAFSASSRVLLGVQTAGRAPTRSDRVIAWGDREKGGTTDSSFWRYKPDLSNFEFKESGPPSRWSFWVNAGVGPSVNMESSSSGVGFGGSANLKFDHYLMQVRSTYNMELTVMGPEPQESLWEVSPMFGFVLKGRVGWISGTAGVGLVGGVGRGKLIKHGDDPSEPDVYEKKEFLDIGFPIDAQLFLKPPSFLMFGLGLNIYANLGPSNSIVGIMLSIMAGG